MQRTELVQIRMTPGEKELVSERARGAGVSVSELLRGLGLGAPAPRKGRGAAALEVAGVPVELDPTVPAGTVEVRDAGGRRVVIERIENLEPAGAAERESGSSGAVRDPASSDGSRSAVSDGAGGSGGSAMSSAVLVRAGAGAVEPVPVFRCPVVDGAGRCVFECRSPRVRCPVHSQKVVPA